MQCIMIPLVFLDDYFIAIRIVIICNILFLDVHDYSEGSVDETRITLLFCSASVENIDKVCQIYTVIFIKPGDLGAITFLSGCDFDSIIIIRLGCYFL